MRKSAVVLSLLFVVIFARALMAKEKQHLPLPQKILAAKLVYIDNQSGQAKIGDRAYEELKKWGRFQVVSDRSQADLIFLLTAKEHTGGYVTSGGTQTGTVDSSGNINATTSPTYTTRVTVGYTYLSVIDPNSGDNLWSEGKKWGNLYTGYHSAAKGLIDELQKRVEEQTKQNASDSKKL